MLERKSGLLLHITSLPSPFGIGDLGPGAYAFADFLEKSRQSFWQILPLNPTDPEFDSCPYHSTSAFAGNPLLISPELLVEEGLLEAEEISSPPAFPEYQAEYRAVIAYKDKLYRKAFDRFRSSGGRDRGGSGDSGGRDRGGDEEFEGFGADQAGWLDDYILFSSLKGRYPGKLWCDWPEELKERKPEALAAAREELEGSIAFERFLQYVFHRQWFALKTYCNDKGIRFLGDVPIYPDYDSAEVWTRPELFKLDGEKKPVVVSGVPPDYFSKTGQRWGHPIYNWEAHREKGYDWWLQRMGHNLALMDWVRIDHFRGLVAFWEVPAEEKIAVNGRWVEGPARDFLGRLKERFSPLPVIAEDLGTITDNVRAVMKEFDLPGMKPLLFAFDGDPGENPYLPHNLVENAVVYTGTHDNNTVRGWFEEEATAAMKERLQQYLGREVPAGELHWELIRLAMTSVAALSIVPVQDLLGLGKEARMNLPASRKGNWRWRVSAGQLTDSLADGLRIMTEVYGRA